MHDREGHPPKPEKKLSQKGEEGHSRLLLEARSALPQQAKCASPSHGPDQQTSRGERRRWMAGGSHGRLVGVGARSEASNNASIGSRVSESSAWREGLTGTRPAPAACRSWMITRCSTTPPGISGCATAASKALHTHAGSRLSTTRGSALAARRRPRPTRRRLSRTAPPRRARSQSLRSHRKRTRRKRKSKGRRPQLPRRAAVVQQAAHGRRALMGRSDRELEGNAPTRACSHDIKSNASLAKHYGSASLSPSCRVQTIRGNLPTRRTVC